MFIGRKSEICNNCVTSNKLKLQNLDTVSESENIFGNLKPFAQKLLLRNEKKTVKLPEGSADKTTGNHYSVGSL